MLASAGTYDHDGAEFTGGIKTSLTLELETEGEAISGISIAAPNWGRCSWAKLSSAQLIARITVSMIFSRAPDAVLTIIVNRVTGNAGLSTVRL